MIRLENMESLEPPGLWEDAQAELEQLAAQMRTKGFDAYVADEDESFHSHLHESAEQVAIEVLNVVYEHGIDAVAAVALEELIRRWARRRRHFRDREGAKATVSVWGPSNEILKTIELPEPDRDD